MRYITPLFLLLACAAASIHGMDSEEQKALALKAQFATICWLQNAEMVKVVGLSDTEVSKESATQLQQAFLASLQAPGFEFPDKTCPIPVLCIDLKKLAPLLEAVQQLRQTAEEKAEQLRRKEEQEKKDKLIAELIQKHKKAHDAHDKLLWAMTFFTGDTEYWNSDLPRTNELRLDSLKQDVERTRTELEKRDPTNKRFNKDFLKAWKLDA